MTEISMSVVAVSSSCSAAFMDSSGEDSQGQMPFDREMVYASRNGVRGGVSRRKGRDGGHALHSQVMRIREEEQHLGEDLRPANINNSSNEMEKISLEMKYMIFSCSRPAFPSPLGLNAGVRSI